MATAVAMDSADSPRNNRFTILPVSKLKMDGMTQPRGNIENDSVIEFADAMAAGDEFPPVIVFYDGLHHWLADGFHRVTAARRAKISTIRCDVRIGDQRDAILYSCGANANHGLRRTNEDKLRSVMRLLEDDEWCIWADNRIAETCGVSPAMVAANRVHSTNARAHSRFRKTIRNGKEGVIDTREIGRSRPARPALAIREPDPARGHAVAEPAQRTATNPIHEYARKLRVAGISFKENVPTDYGMIPFETDDAIIHVVPMITPSSFRDAFATILVQRKQHAPAKKAVIVGTVMDDARPWVAQARHWKVDIMGL